MPPRKKERLKKSRQPGRPKTVCGICGKSARLTTTECCEKPICDDEGSYELFSFSRNSCSRNHRRLTLCGSHFAEGHDGDWQTCQDCLNDVETELYVYYGTNEYNFEKLQNPPSFSPKNCTKCGTLIRLGVDGHSESSKGYFCEECTGLMFRP